MKVVIDTNILISGADDESSYARRIIEEVIAGRIQAYATHQTEGENRQMLRKLVKDRDYRARLEQYFGKINIVKAYQPLQVVSDAEDNKLFESAVAAGADYLISHDQEVLAISEYKKTKVVQPEEFWFRYQNERGDDSAWQDWSKMIMSNN
jgi:putative PIN family toxin of toxin-antitoxin system